MPPTVSAAAPALASAAALSPALTVSAGAAMMSPVPMNNVSMASPVTMASPVSQPIISQAQQQQQQQQPISVASPLIMPAAASTPRLPTAPVQVSIPSTLYVRIFRTNIVSAAFSNYILALAKKLYEKRVCITLMKLTTC